MGVVVESKVKRCGSCGVKTVHNRNTKKMSTGGVIVALALTIMTGGLFLIALVPYLMWNSITSPIAGGWICSKCGH